MLAKTLALFGSFGLGWWVIGDLSETQMSPDYFAHAPSFMQDYPAAFGIVGLLLLLGADCMFVLAAPFTVLVPLVYGYSSGVKHTTKPDMSGPGWDSFS